jgi:phosphatidylserine decarboxylase
MKFHKEGIPSLLLVLAMGVLLNAFTIFYVKDNIAMLLSAIFSSFFLIVILQFFRSPNRKRITDENAVISPADGKIVAIEEVEDKEYFNQKRIQVSVFMSPTNVHINWFPISGVVTYAKYHPGLFLVAWHPKSSTDNERTTVVVKHQSGKEILFRQIAGALARRIVYYCKEKDNAVQGDEFGFIKFGSRVDILLPLDAKIQVKLNQKVSGRQTIIANLS